MKLCDPVFNAEEDLSEIWKQWPTLRLSDFQKWAIFAILKGHHVLIGAHTGSGKTLPAEFAITHFNKKGLKVIYTTPLKAISNQKLYELSKKYPHISFGLITGDNQFNPNADVLIMTTEILRNTLFRMKMATNDPKAQELLTFQMDMQHSLGMVIFDEVHYINDVDRGSAVEESMMMLPKHVQMLMLSATLESPEKLCHFIEKNGQKEVWLTMTHQRVVPLTHYSFITFPPSYLKRFPNNMQDFVSARYEEPIVLKQPNQAFKERAYLDIIKVLKFMNQNRMRVSQFFVVQQMILYLKENNLLPAILFMFSRKRVELFASKIQFTLFPEGSKMPSTIEKKCERIIRSKFSNPHDYLNRSEYTFIISLLKKGIAIHHGGILKEYREMIEILFVEGEYIQLLIATETFSVGVNVPAKTVVLPSLEKFDGTQFRFLKPHEYTQMAGRAGRRGMDTCGKIFHLNNLFERNRVPTNIYQNMLTGKSQRIDSKFKIHFNLLLRLLAANKQDTVSFIKNTMLYDTIMGEEAYIVQQLRAVEEEYAHYTTKVVYNNNMDIISKYYDLRMKLNYLKPKQKKKCRREIDQLKDYHHNLEKDYDKYLKKDSFEKSIVQYKQQIKNIESFIPSTVELHLNILEKEEFIGVQTDADGNKEYTLTEKGEIATLIQEMHSLAMAELLATKIFNTLSSSELSAVLSCFTCIRLSDDMRVMHIDHIAVEPKVKRIIHIIQDNYNKYYDIETKHQTEFVEDYNLHYDMSELIMEWCQADNDAECNAVLAKASQYDIVLGEFVKAVLKINNIAQELEKVCLLQNNMELLEKIKQIPTLTLKSCVTNQSLYL